MFRGDGVVAGLDCNERVGFTSHERVDAIAILDQLLNRRRFDPLGNATKRNVASPGQSEFGTQELLAHFLHELCLRKMTVIQWMPFEHEGVGTEQEVAVLGRRTRTAQLRKFGDTLGNLTKRTDHLSVAWGFRRVETRRHHVIGVGGVKHFPRIHQHLRRDGRDLLADTLDGVSDFGVRTTVEEVAPFPFGDERVSIHPRHRTRVHLSAELVKQRIAARLPGSKSARKGCQKIHTKTSREKITTNRLKADLPSVNIII